MTIEEFNAFLNKEYRFKKIFEYSMAIFVVGIGFYFAYLATFTDWIKNAARTIPHEVISPQAALVFSALLALFGLWGIWKVTKNYKIRTADLTGKDRSLTELVEELSTKMKWRIDGVKDNLVEFHSRRIMEWGYVILMIHEDEKLYFDIQHPSLGIIDFGVQSCMFRRIRKILDCRIFLMTPKSI